MSVRRIFVEKKPEYAVRAKELRQEIENYLGIGTITDVRVLIRYDVEDVSEEVYKEALVTIFSEPPVDFVYEESFPSEEGDTIFTVEYLPGQFDQRADSAEQCVKLLNEEENPVIKSATTYVISGTLTKEQAEAVKSLCINPVDSRENNNPKPATLVTVFDQPEDVKIFEGFCDFAEDSLGELYSSLNLAMTFKDFLHIQNYFKMKRRGTRPLRKSGFSIHTGLITAAIPHSRQSLRMWNLRMVITMSRSRHPTVSIWLTGKKSLKGVMISLSA